MAGTIQILTGPGAMALVGAGGPLLIDREALWQMIDFMVALLDISEPEPDLEEVSAEDSFCIHPDDGPGCPTADTDHCDAREDLGSSALTGDRLPGDPEDAEDNHDREAVEEGI